MPAASLSELLDRNAQHVNALSDTHFEGVEEQQSPPVVSVCCADSRVSQTGMWDVTDPGWLFTPSTIGNVVWDHNGDNRIVDGSVLYPLRHTDTKTLVVVGHTGCGAITAAYDARGDYEANVPPGIHRRLKLLDPVINAGIVDRRIETADRITAINQLVEFNVDQQIAFLGTQDSVPDDVSCFGFVYDLHGVYGTVPGRTYLVNVDGHTAIDTLQSKVPSAYQDCVRRLCPHDTGRVQND